MTEVPIIGTSPLICLANQLIGFYVIGTSVMKELILAIDVQNNLSAEMLILILWFIILTRIVQARY